MQNSIKKHLPVVTAQTFRRHFKRKLFYHAHISLHLTYASTVWDGCSSIPFHKLNSLHRRAAKLMMPEISLRTDAQLQRLRLLPLREKLMLNKAVLVFKACRNPASQYYLKDLSICHNSHAVSRSMILPKPRMNLFKTSFPFAGASLWNSIPAYITSCNSLNFKTQFHKWLRNKMW